MIYRLSSKIISRSKGRVATSAAAYRSGSKIVDEKTGNVYDYSRKSDVFFCKIILPEGVDRKFEDRSFLWNKVELCEKRKDAQLAREIELALPRELGDKDNIELAMSFIKDQFVSKGMIADLCFHKGHGGDQPHVHVMLTMRGIDGDGFGKKNTDWNKKHLLQVWREEWANYVNMSLEKAGIEGRVDHRSNLERGIDLEPQKKVGGVGRLGMKSTKYVESLEIAKRNGEKIKKNPDILLDALSKNVSVFTKYDIEKLAARYSVGDDMKKLVIDRVMKNPNLVELGKNDRGQICYSSREMIDIEYRMVRQALALKGKDGVVDNGDDNRGNDLSHNDLFYNKVTGGLSDIFDSSKDFMKRVMSIGHGVNAKAQDKICRKYKFSAYQEEGFKYITKAGDIACLVGVAGSGRY